MTDEPVPIEPGPELDLHTFRPSELGELLPEWFDGCLERGIHTVRLIHGKGSGTLREGVHALLKRLPQVREFQYPAGESSGGWGATWVVLNPPAPESRTGPKAG